MKGFLKKGGYTSLAPKDSTSNGTISRKEEEEEEEEEKIEYEAVYPSKFTRSCTLFFFFSFMEKLPTYIPRSILVVSSCLLAQE